MSAQCTHVHTCHISAGADPKALLSAGDSKQEGAFSLAVKTANYVALSDACTGSIASAASLIDQGNRTPKKGFWLGFRICQSAKGDCT